MVMAFHNIEASSNPLSIKTQGVKNYFDEKITDSEIPGIQYIVLNANNVLYEYMGGWADIALKKPMQINKTMMAYSQTKTITAIAVLQLYEAGKLDLDDTIDLYVKNLPYSKPITIRQMLSQTSGLPNPIPLKWAHLIEEHQQFNEDAALAQVMADSLDLSFEPGEKYQYSNISYWLLGQVIEIVSGMEYEDYIRKYFIEALKINQNALDFIIPNLNNHAKGYLDKYSFLNLFKGFLLDKKLIGEESTYEGSWLLIKDHYLNGSAFGGLVGTAKGFSLFLQDQLRPTSVLFSNKIKTLLYSQQKTNDGDLIDMTLGWHIGYNKSVKYYFKEGGGAGFHCEMRIYPDQSIASIIMVNKTSFKPKKTLDRIDKEFFDM